MKAGILEKPEQLVVKDVPKPELQKGTVIIRVKACSVCGTDLRTYHHGHARIKLPHILGHEVSGEVEAVAADVTSYHTGDRVALTPRIACGECFYCRRGQSIYCQNSRTFGYELPGGYAQYMLIPPRGVQYGVLNIIADCLSLEEASLAEPFSCCIRAQETSRVRLEDTIVVVGGGPIGLMHCHLARINGAGQVILVERETKRLEQVNLSAVDSVIDSSRSDPEAEIIALTAGRGADVVIVACSSPQAQEQALSLAAKGGRVNFFGGLAPDQARITLDSNIIHYREVSLQGSHGTTPRDTRKALAILAKYPRKFDDLISPSFPLDYIEEAFRLADSRNSMHVTIRP
ncbi:zinc-dependent dehydrogenase [Chloroflexota bacterium]